MIIKDLKEEWFQDYKKPSMFIAFPRCSFKCDKECGSKVCQNSTLASSPDFAIDAAEIVDIYLSNPITTAIVCGGLEPFDSPFELCELVYELRKRSSDDIVIYTGYTEDEFYAGFTDFSDMTHADDWQKSLAFFSLRNIENIIVKFGRFVPNEASHYDDILGVTLASTNQYAKRISKESLF